MGATAAGWLSFSRLVNTLEPVFSFFIFVFPRSRSGAQVSWPEEKEEQKATPRNREGKKIPEQDEIKVSEHKGAERVLQQPV